MEELNKQIGKVTNNLLQDILKRFVGKVLFTPTELNDGSIYTFKYTDNKLKYEESVLGAYNIPYYTGTGFANSGVIFKNGNIGIGVSEPQYNLDVSGSVRLNVELVDKDNIRRGDFTHIIGITPDGNIARVDFELEETLDSVASRGNYFSGSSIVLNRNKPIEDNVKHGGRIGVYSAQKTLAWGSYVNKVGNDYNLIVGAYSLINDDFIGTNINVFGHYVLGKLVSGSNNSVFGNYGGALLEKADYFTSFGFNNFSKAKLGKYVTTIGSYVNSNFSADNVDMADLEGVSPIFSLIKTGWLKTLYGYDESTNKLANVGITSVGSVINSFSSSPTRGVGTVRIGFNQGSNCYYRDYNNVVIGSNIYSNRQHQTHNSMVIGNFILMDDAVSDNKFGFHISKSTLTNFSDSLLYGDFSERWFKINGQLKLDLNRIQDVTNDNTITKELVPKQDGTIAIRDRKPEVVVQVPDKIELGYVSGGFAENNIAIHSDPLDIYYADEQMYRIKYIMQNFTERKLRKTEASNWSFYTIPNYNNGEPLFEFVNKQIIQKKSNELTRYKVGNYKFKVPLPINDADWQIRFETNPIVQYPNMGAGIMTMGFTDDDSDDVLEITNPIFNNYFNDGSMDLGFIQKRFNFPFVQVAQFIITKIGDIINTTVIYSGKEITINRKIVAGTDAENLYFVAVFEGYNNINESMLTSFETIHRLRDFRYYINTDDIINVTYAGRYEILYKVERVKEVLPVTTFTPLSSSDWTLRKTNSSNLSKFTDTGISLVGSNADNNITRDGVISMAVKNTPILASEGSDDRPYVFRINGSLGHIRAYYGGTGVIGFLNDNGYNNAPDPLNHIDVISSGLQYVSGKYSPDGDTFKIEKMRYPDTNVVYYFYCFTKYVVFEVIHKGEVVKRRIIEKENLVGIKPFVSFMKLYNNNYANNIQASFGEYASVNI